MRLELNNSGSWKIILHDVDPDHVEAARAAVLELLACDRHVHGKARFALTETSQVHPGGRVLAVTRGLGAAAVWEERG